MLYVWLLIRRLFKKLVTLQKDGNQFFIHRSHSVPELNKDGSLRQLESLGGVFRVVSIAPRVTEGPSAPSNATPPLDAGKFNFPICIDFDLILTSYLDHVINDIQKQKLEN